MNGKVIVFLTLLAIGGVAWGDDDETFEDGGAHHGNHAASEIPEQAMDRPVAMEKYLGLAQAKQYSEMAEMMGKHPWLKTQTLEYAGRLGGEQGSQIRQAVEEANLRTVYKTTVSRSRTVSEGVTIDGIPQGR